MTYTQREIDLMLADAWEKGVLAQNPFDGSQEGVYDEFLVKHVFPRNPYRNDDE